MSDPFEDLVQSAREARRSNDFESARDTYIEAVTLAREQQDDLVLAHTVRHLADVYRNLDELDEAEPLYEEALAIYRSDARTSNLALANALRPMALLHEKRNQLNAAKDFWIEAERLYESVGVEAGVEECRQAIDRCS